MVTKSLSSMDRVTNMAANQPVAGSLPTKKNQGKVPKKMHKAEREKLKRDQLNDLFLELGHALEPARQNNGKASILGDATRILRELILQVQSLRKENLTLVTESHYVTVEKDELKDENLALESEITKIHTELRENLQSNTNTDPAIPTQSPTTGLHVPLPFVVPFSDPMMPPSAPKASTQVRRPHARYPTPSDSWPLQILSRSQNSTNSGSSGGDEA